MRYRKGSGRSRIDQHALHRIRFHDAPTANITFTKRISERGRPPVVETMSHRIRGDIAGASWGTRESPQNNQCPIGGERELTYYFNPTVMAREHPISNHWTVDWDVATIIQALEELYPLQQEHRHIDSRARIWIKSVVIRSILDQSHICRRVRC